MSYFIHLASAMAGVVHIYIGTQGASYWSLSQFSMFFMEHNISNEENLAAKKIALKILALSCFYLNNKPETESSVHGQNHLLIDFVKTT